MAKCLIQEKQNHENKKVIIYEIMWYVFKLCLWNTWLSIVSTKSCPISSALSSKTNLSATFKGNSAMFLKWGFVLVTAVPKNVNNSRTLVAL